MLDYAAVLGESQPIPPAMETIPELMREEALTREDSPAVTDPYDMTPFRAKLKPYEDELEKMQDRAEALKVVDDESAAEATDLGVQCAAIERAVEEARKYFKAPALAFSKNIDAFANAYKDKAQAAKRSLSGKLGAYQRKKEEEARELLRRQQEEARKLQAQAEAEAKALGTDAPQVVVPASAPVPTQIRTTQGKAVMQKRWVCTVENPDLVPREYCEVSQTLLNKAMAAGIREIPGCKIEHTAESRFSR